MLEPLQEVQDMLRPHVRLAVRAFAALLGLFLLASGALWSVDIVAMPGSIDGAWMMSLTDAAAHGEISGRDTYATYGWAFQRLGLWARALHLDGSVYDSTPLFSVLLSALGATVLIVSLLLLRSLDAAGILAACVVASLLNLGQAAWLRASCLILVAALTARLLADSGSRQFLWRLIALAVFGASLQSLSFDLGVYAVLTIAGAAVLHGQVEPSQGDKTSTLRSRVREAAYRAVVVLAAAAITFLTASLALSAGPAGPFDYLAILSELSSGYTATLGYPWQAALPWTLALGALVLFVIVAAAADLRGVDPVARAEAAPLLLAGLLFARGGTTRSDIGHITLAAVPLVVCFLVFALRTGQRLRRRLAAVIVLGALGATWPGAGFQRLALAARGVVEPDTVQRRVTELRSLAASRAVYLPVPLRAAQSSNLVVFPYLNQFAHVSGRQLIAPLVQSYQATTAGLDRLYADRIARDPRAREVLYAIDDVAVGRIDGVHAITRNPAIFSEFFRDFRPVGPAADGHILLLRSPTQRELPAASLAFTAAPYGIELAVPAECALLRVGFRVDYPWTRALGRPSPWRASIQDGETTVATTQVVPLDRSEFATLLHTGPATDIAAVLEGNAPRYRFDRIVLEPTDRSLFSVAPRAIEVTALECLTP